LHEGLYRLEHGGGWNSAQRRLSGLSRTDGSATGSQGPSIRLMNAAGGWNSMLAAIPNCSARLFCSQRRMLGCGINTVSGVKREPVCGCLMQMPRACASIGSSLLWCRVKPGCSDIAP
jgi:hypothetical protein